MPVPLLRFVPTQTTAMTATEITFAGALVSTDHTIPIPISIVHLVDVIAIASHAIRADTVPGTIGSPDCADRLRWAIFHQAWIAGTIKYPLTRRSWTRFTKFLILNQSKFQYPKAGREWHHSSQFPSRQTQRNGRLKQLFADALCFLICLIQSRFNLSCYRGLLHRFQSCGSCSCIVDHFAHMVIRWHF